MAFVLLTGFNICSEAKTPKIQTGPNAEVSFDGLHKVDKTIMDDVWAKPDVDLSQYKKIILKSTTVAFKDVDTKSSRLYRRTGKVNEFSITEKNKEKIVNEIKSAFKKQLSKVQNYQLTDDVGDDVLSIEAFIIDIVSHVPPESYSKTDVYLRSAGEATLVLEFRDSISDEILVRAVDHRDTEQNDILQKVSPITNLIEFRKLASDWGRTLRKRLDEIVELSK
ncbi:MAG: DUF3313 family protein [Marinicella sp.]